MVEFPTGVDSRPVQSLCHHGRVRSRTIRDRTTTTSLLFSATACLGMTRTTRGDEPPETARVIHLAAVHQLVQQDVLAHEWRRLDEAPVERDGPDGEHAPQRER